MYVVNGLYIDLELAIIRTIYAGSKNDDVDDDDDDDDDNDEM